MKNWKEYNRWNKRNEKMSYLWVLDTFNWLCKNRLLTRDKIIFDYGCGYFDLGALIAPFVYMVDGYDPFPPGIEMARQRYRHLNNIQLDDTLNTFLPKQYDVIILNSVVQYFQNEEELMDFFRISRNLLRDFNSLILFTDIIPTNYSPIMDAMENIFYASTKGILIPMLAHLFKAASKPKQLNLFSISETRLEKIAVDSGLEGSKILKNLTPSKRRYSIMFRKYDTGNKQWRQH